MATPIALLSVRARPHARKTEVSGWQGDSLKIAVKEAPEAGKANAAICDLVAGLLSFPRSQVRVLRGMAAPRKVLEISGISPDELAARLDALFPGKP